MNHAGLMLDLEQLPEYWIVNLVDGVIEVHTEPRNAVYQQVTHHGRGAVVTLRAFLDVSIAVDEVLH